MRNLPPSTLTALPHGYCYRIADLERAFNTRRRALRDEVANAALVGRILAQPITGRNPPHEQPRDGRGRFMSKAWLVAAEAFMPSDCAWFRSPIAEGK